MKLFSLVFLFLFPCALHAATQLFDTNGKLIGAQNVVIGSVVYNVRFEDGSCRTVYDGCNDPADFTFLSEASAHLAGVALLDQVLIGSVDSSPAEQFGCDPNEYRCITLIAYGPMYTVPGSSVLGVDTIRVTNFDSNYPASFDHVADSPFRATEPTTYSYSEYVYAKFEHVGSVPVPGAAFLLLTGLGVGTLLGRRSHSG